MLRKSFVVLSVVGLAAFAQGCGNDCDAAADDIEAKAEECGIDTSDGDGGDAEVECTDSRAANATCVASCFTNAPCDALTGDDPEGALDFVACLGDCPAP